VADALRGTRARAAPDLSFPLLFERYTSRNQGIYLGSEQLVLPANVLIDANGVLLDRVSGATPEALERLRLRIEQHVSSPS
jgi:hypothetical protein